MTNSINKLINQYQKLVILYNFYGSTAKNSEAVKDHITYKFDNILSSIMDNFAIVSFTKEEVLEAWYKLELFKDKINPLSTEFLKDQPNNLLPIIIVRALIGKHHKLPVYAFKCKNWTDFCNWANERMPTAEEQEYYRNSKNTVDESVFDVTLQELLRRLKYDAGGCDRET